MSDSFAVIDDRGEIRGGLDDGPAMARKVGQRALAKLTGGMPPRRSPAEVLASSEVLPA